ncbi:MAG: ribonuclease PH [Actinobacteria bacterium]|nr:MAG: ribonuclease PH [Actinomycetota bacterium]
MRARADRGPDELRRVQMSRGYTDMTPGSVLIEMGRTRVLCTVSFDFEVPPWMRESGEGWVTAEYSMLPGSSRERVRRSSISGGRTKEIQRLIGRSLRAVVDLKAMGSLTARVDCDVLQADGGTRTASVTGSWVALADGFDALLASGRMAASPIVDHVAAVSAGIFGDDVLLDLDYEEDIAADVDANVVMTGSGRLVEVQGTAEGRPFARAQLDRLLDLTAVGIERLVAAQRAARGTPA